MSTVRLTESVVVERPSEQVWRLVADYDADPRWRAGVLTMSPSPAGPVVVGTTTASRSASRAGSGATPAR